MLKQPTSKVRKLLTGFPLHKPVRRFLDDLVAGPSERPSGIGPSTILTVQTRKWAQRSERYEAYGPEMYSITALGRAARDIDDIAAKYDLRVQGKRERGPRGLPYADLPERLEALRKVDD